MWNLDLEYAILKEILSNWEQFLFSKNIYWPIQLSNRHFSPQDTRVQVTCGRLLISDYLLEKSSDGHDPQIKKDLNKFDHLKNNWLSNWRLKVSKELPVRINDWSRVIRDLKSDRSKAELSNRVQIRLMIDLLQEDLSEDERNSFLILISELDHKFNQLTIENGFLWEEEFVNIFPLKEFWYLYRSLK